MNFQSFGLICPEIAFRETWRFTLPTPQADLKPGHYTFLEHYCADSSCDCRRVWLVIQYHRQWPPGNASGTHIATVGFGWESPEFYVNWAHGDPEAADLSGPLLEPFQQQPKTAETGLEMAIQVIFSRTEHVLRLRQHYRAFRANLPWLH